MRVRNEIVTRLAFAKRKGIKHFNGMKGIEETGNIMSSRHTKKFLQAKRIYDHYINEFTLYLKSLPNHYEK